LGFQLFTDRLNLVASTLELAIAEMSDLEAFAKLLDVPRPPTWPPPLNDEGSQQHFLASLQKAGPKDAGWNLWFCILLRPREIVGVAGFKDGPSNGVAEIGYSMLEPHQGKGYCTEAVRSLVSWAFGNPAVNVIAADTFSEVTRSIRVVEKCGFKFAGDGPIEDGRRTIRYELTREQFDLFFANSGFNK
jgi:ribosomal-protein-alanine N-acetyltransferase